MPTLRVIKLYDAQGCILFQDENDKHVLFQSCGRFGAVEFEILGEKFSFGDPEHEQLIQHYIRNIEPPADQSTLSKEFRKWLEIRTRAPF